MRVGMLYFMVGITWASLAMKYAKTTMVNILKLGQKFPTQTELPGKTSYSFLDT